MNAFIIDKVTQDKDTERIWIMKLEIRSVWNAHIDEVGELCKKSFFGIFWQNSQTFPGFPECWEPCNYATSSSDYAAPLSAVSVLQFLPLNHASRKKLNRQTAISVMQFDNNIRKYRGTEVVWGKINPHSYGSFAIALTHVPMSICICKKKFEKIKNNKKIWKNKNLVRAKFCISSNVSCYLADSKGEVLSKASKKVSSYVLRKRYQGFEKSPACIHALCEYIRSLLVARRSYRGLRHHHRHHRGRK